MNTITFDDLTFEDLAIIRGHMDILSRTQNITLPYDVFVNIAIDKYNRGEYDLIKQKGDKVDEDLFTEVVEVKPTRRTRTIKTKSEPTPVFIEETPKVDIKLSNIGKKILVEFDDDQVCKYTLVASSDEVDADLNRISTHSDLGKVLEYATEGKLIEFKDRYIRIVEITNAYLKT